MQLKKSERRLLKLNRKAEACLTRKKALKIIKKYEKANTTVYESIRSDDTLL